MCCDVRCYNDVSSKSFQFIKVHVAVAARRRRVASAVDPAANYYAVTRWLALKFFSITI